VNWDGWEFVRQILAAASPGGGAAYALYPGTARTRDFCATRGIASSSSNGRVAPFSQLPDEDAGDGRS